MSFHHIGINGYLFVNGKKSISWKFIDKDLNFPSLFYLGRISEECDRNESLEGFCKGNMYNFSVNHSVKHVQIFICQE